jgi:hypothetical protein
MPHASEEQQLSTSPAPVAVIAQDPIGAQFKQLEDLQQRAMQLELRVSDLSLKTSQLREQRDAASPADRPRLDKQWADAQHDMSAAAIELSALHSKINHLEMMTNPSTAVVMQPPPAPDPFLDREQIMQVLGGSALLMFPLVLALARRLWVRGARRVQVADLESSPRLQRMEQAIESIAVEVERIGEAQRFTTKLLTERPLAAEANRLAPAAIPVARRESGTVTPH